MAYTPAMVRVSSHFFVVFVLFGCASSQFLEKKQGEDTESQRPNILVIFTDDHATAAISSYRSVINQTPHLDRLAEEGVLFENAFVTNSICAPSRAVLLTGRHSHHNGVRDNGDIFDGSQTTFPRLLKEGGYQTALVGKWHLKSDPVGFDYWEILPGQGQYYSPDFKTAEGTRQYEGYTTEITTDLALSWLEEERDPDRPFLLMCQHKAPHRSWMPSPEKLALYKEETIPEPSSLFDDYEGRGPAAANQEMTIARHMFLHYDLKMNVHPDEMDALEGPDQWVGGLLDRMTPVQREAWQAAYGPSNASFREKDLEGDDLVRWKYQRYIKDYLRCIASVDDGVGQILDRLDRLGLAENTVVVYASDQGFFLGEHGWYDKRFMYEPSLRFPLLVRWPREAPAGLRVTQLVQNLDLAPTFLELAGVTVPEEMDGESLASLLRGETPANWRTSVYYEYFERGIHAVEPHSGVRTDRYKLIHFHDSGSWELYDLAKDPGEMDNRYDDPGLGLVRAKLHQELVRLRAEAGRT